MNYFPDVLVCCLFKCTRITIKVQLPEGKSGHKTNILEIGVNPKVDDMDVRPVLRMNVFNVWIFFVLTLLHHLF